MGRRGVSPLQLIDFGRQHEIAFREPVDLVRPNRDLCFAPAEADIGMVTLFLGHLADSIDELEAFAKVLEPVCLVQVMPVDDLPRFQLS